MGSADTLRKKELPTDLLMKKSEERYMLMKKIQDQNKHILEKERNIDELDLFFKTMAVTAKKLQIEGKLEAKVKIFRNRTTQIFIN